MYDISILVPSIRPHYWIRLYDSISKACKKHSWELIFAGPFFCEEMRDKPNVTFLQTYTRIPVCWQKMGLIVCSNIIYHLVDDVLLDEDSIDICLDLRKSEKHTDNDIIQTRYVEGENFIMVDGENNPIVEFPLDYFRAGHWLEFQMLPGINPTWKLATLPLMNRKTWMDLGGFDCSFEYSNHPHQDFAFRFQQLGGIIHFSPTTMVKMDHIPKGKSDHEVIVAAQEGPDFVKFQQMWMFSNNRTFINYNNWKDFDIPWTRRFHQHYKTYEEMRNIEGY